MVTKENDIELDLISKLKELKYIHRPDVHDRASLEQNFRKHFESLNRVQLSDGEFSRLLDSIVTADVFAAAKRLREQNSFERDDGTQLHYTLVNTRDWCKNTFEVINQLKINTDYSHHRYDVVLLINGVPAVQIELKNLQISPHKAMQQIIGYMSDPGNGYGKTLLCFMQFFIVSNRTDTWYFANNNKKHFSFGADERFLPIYQFADQENKKITQLHSFADAFLAKCALGEMISRYMVLVASDQKLMMMRPYQIYAVKAIVDCVHRHCGNGYIWHTTGSGKTLTSFKASTLLKDNPDIDKCLFVVDRKDLDRQTREEFNKFQEGCVEENTNTETMVQRLLSEDYADKVIVTTIQKLGLALDAAHKANFKRRLEPLRKRRMVFIFDECHRSQFGENHKAIKEFFPDAQLFGFTGTPIFNENASLQKIQGQQGTLVTTADVFQQELHAYTITHAIEDRNVLRFHVDYLKPEGSSPPAPGEPPDKRAVVEAILKKHDDATGGRKFNALLATASINDAIAYHGLFKELQQKRAAERPDFKPLNIACVFSPPAEGNKDMQQNQEDLPQEKADNQEEPDQKKAALEAIIDDYNATYGANHKISEFDNYYQDLQKRIKDQQYPNADLPHAQKIDITIVVDMLLTGFDSKFLNTLYVDKPLRYHGLVQAFSRTNRVLNDTKPYGNILDFRQQQGAVDDAIALFSGQAHEQAREIWLVDKSPKVIKRLELAVQSLDTFMESHGLPTGPESVPNLKGDAARAEFITLFKEVQRLSTQLSQYTDLTPEELEAIKKVMPPERLQAFQGAYLETAEKLKEIQETQGDSAHPAVRELDFEFVLFACAIIDYDYIMELIARYSGEPAEKQKMSREQLISLIASDSKFIDDREDLKEYIGSLAAGKPLDEQAIRDGFEAFKAGKRAREMTELAQRHGLDASALQGFIDITLDRTVLDGDLLSELFAPQKLPWKSRAEEEQALMKELIPLFRKLAHGREISGISAYEQ